MTLGPRLDLRHSQSLVMTPLMQQAVKLLHMTNMELQAFVEQEIESNPLLELEDPDGLPETGAREEAVNWNQGGGIIGGDAPDTENLAARPVTLQEHLMAQINVDFDDPADRMIAVMLIDGLDDAGYFIGDISQIAETVGCSPERVARTLQRARTLDPSGIFAATLSECLEAQLKDRNRLDTPMLRLLENLDLLGKHDLNPLRKLCGVSPERLADMISEIQQLNPRPASDFDHVVIQHVTPDILVRPDRDGGWVVELNSETLPRVLVNSRYYAVVKKNVRSKEEQEYLIDCFQSANWLVKALQQRAQNILKVATELVRRQVAFLEHGVQHLEPLTQRDIAEEVELSESTVSRVTSNKFIGLSRGVFAMKYLLTTGVGHNMDGQAHAAEAIRFRISEMIESETPDSVLSDDKIVLGLRTEGVDIARRTVAKYRDAMHIPSSIHRRRAKFLNAP